MRKVILLMALALAICGCHGQAVKSEKAVEETTVNQMSDADAVAQRVQEIYGAVFKVYNEEDSLRNLDIQMENDSWKSRDKFNNDFCSKEWNTLLAKVDEIDSLYHSGELGFWEADYWIMGQDWHNLSISDVKVVSVDEEKAVVEFQLHNFDSAQAMRVVMVKEDDIWKIDTFIEQSGYDWKQELEEYVKQEDKSAENKNN